MELRRIFLFCWTLQSLATISNAMIGNSAVVYNILGINNATWRELYIYCEKQTFTLCMRRDIFRGELKIPVKSGVLHGTQLAPIGDQHNAWVHIGHDRTASVVYNKSRVIEEQAYVFCCRRKINVHSSQSGIQAMTTRGRSINISKSKRNLTKLMPTSRPVEEHVTSAPESYQSFDKLNNLLLSPNVSLERANNFLFKTSWLLEDLEVSLLNATTFGEIKEGNYYNDSRINTAVIIANQDTIKARSSPLVSFEGVSLQQVALQPGHNITQAVVVVTRIELPKTFQAQFMKDDLSSNNIATTDFSIPQVPLFSVSAFDRANNNRIQADVNYSIEVGNNDDITNYVIAVMQNEVGRGKLVIRKINYVCKYYHVEKRKYSNKGCKLIKQQSQQVHCHCNHTTIFSVLLSVESFKIPSEIKIISYITESVSLVCLLLTLIILIKIRKKIRLDRTNIQINLALALTCLHSFNLLHDVASTNKRTCQLIAIAIHYFLLTTVVWMFIEGFTLVIKTTNKALRYSNQHPKTISKIRLLVGWGLPALIVGMATTVGFVTNTYMDKIVDQTEYKRCWLDARSGVMIASVVFPIALIYIINVCITIKVIFFVYKMNSASNRLKPASQNMSAKDSLLHIKAAVKDVVLLFPILGIPWILSFLSGLESHEASIVFMHLNVIFNGLQGLFVFLVYCVLGSDVRKTCIRRINQSIAVLSSLDKKRIHKSNTVGISNIEVTATMRNNFV